MKLLKHQLDLLIESISYHQLHLQKIHEQSNDQERKNQIFYKHEELAHLSEILIKELDNYDKKN